MSAFICGLDLGQASDYSALVIVEKRQDLGYDPALVQTVTESAIATPGWEAAGVQLRSPVYEQRTRQAILGPNGQVTYVDGLPAPRLLSYDVRHIQRWPLGTSYPAIVSDVNALMARPLLLNAAPLVLDGTGVGRPVVDMFRQSARYAMTPVLITAGATVSTDEAGYTHVPKRDLVGATQVLLQNKQVRIGPSLPEAQTLTSELQTFQTKISVQTAHESFGAWREGQHDDLVLALALALWFATTRQSIGAYL